MSETPPRNNPLFDLGAALALAAGYVFVLLRTVGDLGYARDEGFYFDAAASYARWFEMLAQDASAALAPAAIDRYWGANHEHPALMKSLFALSNLILQKRFSLFAMEGTSYRFPGMVVSALGVAVVYLWGARARGRFAGLSAAVFLAAMPRFFYHAHLACFDAPIAAIFCLCTYAYWRSLGGGWKWPIAAGILFGLALDTKHNAWFLPILCGAHAGFLVLRARLLGGSAEPPRRAIAALACMAVLGPLVFYALWPWIWHDTGDRLLAYAQFHLNHDYYNMELFGENYWKPPMPRSYAWVMTAATVPAVTLALFVAGLWLRGRPRIASLLARLRGAPSRGPAGDPAATDLLWVLAILVSYGAWLSNGTPIFGGTKHWMTAYPFMALFAGTALSCAARAAARELGLLGRRGRTWARKLSRRPFPEILVGVAALSAPLVETAHSHPWGLSSYTPLVGGASGAATLGLNRTFWGYTTGAVTGYLNETVRRGGSVYVHDTAGPSWDMLLRDGRLRRDIRGTGSAAGADVALYHHEKHMLGQEYQAWGVYGTVRPDHVGGLDGVPVILVYRHPEPR